MTLELELRGVQQRFHARGVAGGYVTAVDDVSFTLAASPPQIVSLVGQSGSGKSTIARNVLGLQKPTAGSVRYARSRKQLPSSRKIGPTAHGPLRSDRRPVEWTPGGVIGGRTVRE